LQLRELGILDARPGNPHHVPTWRHHVPQQADCFTHPAARPIAFDRAADPPADGETTPAEGFTIAYITQHQYRKGVACATLSHLPESRFVRQTIAAIQVDNPNQ